MTIYDRIVAELDLYIEGLKRASGAPHKENDFLKDKVIGFENGPPPEYGQLEKLPINISDLSDQEAMEIAHGIVKTKGASEVNQLKILILKQAEAAKKAAVFEQTEAVKSRLVEMADKLNVLHIKLCFAQKKAFQPQPGGRGKTVPSLRTVYKEASRERGYLKGIETEAHLDDAVQSLRDKGRPISLYGIGEFRKDHEMKARIEAARARRPNSAETRKLKNIKIHHLPMAKLAGKIKPGSVDIILTDPPYQKGDRQQFEDLGVFAERVLKPGGSLVCMAGNMYLPEWIKGIEKTKALKWHFQIHYAYKGPTARLFARSVCVSAKPVLWFVKGKYKGKWINNFVHREGSFDQKYHKWEQSVDGMHAILRKFQPAGQLVCDPFVGGGASAIAAFYEGCRFIGGDIDKTAAETTRGRLYEAAAKYDKTQIFWK